VLALIKSFDFTDNQALGAFQSTLIHRCLPHTKKDSENTNDKRTD
jgi:hypothetical protein